MYKLHTYNCIDRCLLDPQHYLESLLSQARSKELLDERTLTRIEGECIQLFTDQCNRYTCGESSSVRVEVAQDLMTSNLFTISLWLKTYQNPDDALAALHRQSIRQLYDKGSRRLESMLTQTKAIHARLMKQLLQTPNVFYRSTISDGIAGFFKLYRPEFAAHSIHITADYPSFLIEPRLLGIEFIQSYLVNLYHENLFCSYFSTHRIHHLLCGFIPHYQDHLFNLYEPVLLSALACTLIGRDVYTLDLTAEGACYLYDRLSSMSPEKIATCFHQTLQQLIGILDCPKRLTDYLQNSLPKMISHIQLAVREQTMDRLFVLPGFPENEPRISISWGVKMEDNVYRQTLDAIQQSRSSQDRIQIIKDKIRSFADLQDVLTDADLTEQESLSILGLLAPEQIAVLCKQYLPMVDMDSFFFQDKEQALRNHLSVYYHGLCPAKQKQIRRICELP